MPFDELKDRLHRIRSEGLERSLRVMNDAQRGRARVDGREVLSFSSNDYLALAADTRVCEAAMDAVAAHGAGAGSARLIAGNFPPHVALERALARWKGTDEALLFSSGYHANVGILTALVDAGDAIFSDALNHASIIDGCRLSRARCIVYPHADTDALDVLLKKDIQEHGNGRAGSRRLIVTDTVFGMDGDMAPLQGIVDVARRHGAEVVVDEAHASGVLGPRGAGLCAAQGFGQEAVAVQMGTLGKALGAMGAFVAGPKHVVQYLMQRARPFIFTTAAPPAVVAAALAALRIADSDEGEERRARLRAASQRFRSGLKRLGIASVGGGGTPIVPVLVGDPHKAVRACEALLEHRVWAQVIRAPTVPPGTERLRFAFTCEHTAADVDAALAALQACRHLVATVDTTEATTVKAL